MKRYRQAPEEEVVRAVASLFLREKGAEVRYEVPHPTSKVRLDLLARRPSGELSAVSAKERQCTALYKSALPWVPYTTYTFVAYREAVNESQVWEVAQRALTTSLGIGVIVLDGTDARVLTKPEARPGVDTTLLWALACERGSNGMLNPGGSAGGRTLSKPSVDAEKVAAYFKAGGIGPRALEELCDDKDPLHLQRVAEAINSRRARHLGILARRSKVGWWVVRR